MLPKVLSQERLEATLEERLTPDVIGWRNRVEQVVDTVFLPDFCLFQQGFASEI